MKWYAVPNGGGDALPDNLSLSQIYYRSSLTKINTQQVFDVYFGFIFNSLLVNYLTKQCV